MNIVIIKDKLNSIFTKNQRKRVYNAVFDSIDEKQFNIIYEKYTSKFFNRERYINRAVNEAFRLKLHKSKGLSILDLGTGSAYFPYTCRYMGHEAMGLDLGDSPMFNEFIEMLNVKRTIHEIKPFEPLPPLGRFDIITAHSICFNQYKDGIRWGAKEWEYLINDLIENHLNNKYKISLRINGHDRIGKSNRYYSKELFQFFVDSGAIVYKNTVLYSGEKK